MTPVRGARLRVALMIAASLSLGCTDAPGYAGLQKILLGLSSRSSQLVSDKSFHSIELSQPEVVVDGIRQAIEAVQ